MKHSFSGQQFITTARPTFATKFVRFSVYLLVFFYTVPIFNIISPDKRVDQLSDASDLANQIIALSLFSVAIISAFAVGLSPRLILLGLTPFILFVTWALASIYWSGFPDLTTRRAIRLAIELTTFILLALSSRNDDHILRVFFRAFLLTNVILLASLLFPAISFRDGTSFSSFYPQKNTAGLFFAIAIPLFAFGIYDRSISRSRLIAGAAFGSAMGMLLLTDSKTAMHIVPLAAVLATLTFYADIRRGGLAALLVAYGCLFCMLMGLMIMSVGISGTVALVVSDPTFTGRDEIWNYTLYRFHSSPAFLGVGYGGLWQVGKSLQRSLNTFGMDFVVNDAHNGYLDVLAQLGYVGIVFLAVFFLVSYRRILRYVRSSVSEGRIQRLVGLYCLYIFYSAVIHNITETSLFLGGDMLWMVLVFFITVSCPVVNRIGGK